MKGSQTGVPPLSPPPRCEEEEEERRKRCEEHSG